MRTSKGAYRNRAKRRWRRHNTNVTEPEAISFHTGFNMGWNARMQKDNNKKPCPGCAERDRKIHTAINVMQTVHDRVPHGPGVHKILRDTIEELKNNISHVKCFDHALTPEEISAEVKKSKTERDYWIAQCRNCDTIFNVAGSMDILDFPQCCDSPDITVFSDSNNFDILLITLEE